MKFCSDATLLCVCAMRCNGILWCGGALEILNSGDLVVLWYTMTHSDAVFHRFFTQLHELYLLVLQERIIKADLVPVSSVAEHHS